MRPAMLYPRGLYSGLRPMGHVYEAMEAHLREYEPPTPIENQVAVRRELIRLMMDEDLRHACEVCGSVDPDGNVALVDRNPWPLYGPRGTHESRWAEACEDCAITFGSNDVIWIADDVTDPVAYEEAFRGEEWP